MPASTLRILAVITAIVTVSIWASFLLGTRYAVSGSFSVPEVLILRLVPAAIGMIPLMLRLGVWPHGLSWFGAAMIMVGASALFPFLISMGLYYAPASDAGALAPGMLPFWTALAAYVMTGEVPGRRARIGLVLILAGAMMIGLWQILLGAHSGAWRGYLLFFAGSSLWSVYSVIYRRSHISPLHGLVIGLFWGAVLATPALLLTGDVSFAAASLSDIAVMIFLQSFVIAIMAMLLFSFAVKQLGAPQTAAFGALTPVLAMLGGWFFLGEDITTVKAVGVGFVAAGVILASGILSKRS